MRWSRRDDAEATDSLEVPTIAGDDTETVRESGRRDPEVVRARNVAAAGQACPHLGVNASDRLGDRYGLEAGEHMFHERAPPLASGHL